MAQILADAAPSGALGPATTAEAATSKRSWAGDACDAMSYGIGSVRDMVAPDVARSSPGYLLGEREMLDGWLDYHRATLLWKCGGLTDDQLREKSCPPSTLSLLGLVRHMTDV